MLRKIVVETDRMALVVAEIFAHGGRGEGRDVLHRCGFAGRGRDDDAVLHGAVVRQRFHHLRDRRAFLPDRAVNANHVPALLIQNRVEDDGGLAGLAVADDQFALPAPDRNHRINGLDAGLHRLAHGLAIHHARGNALERVALVRLHRAFAVQRLPERIHHAPDHSLAHRHGHNSVRALHRVAFADLGVVAEQHRADLIFLEVQRDAEHAVREFQHFAGHAAVQAVNARDAVADGNHRADFLHRDCLLIVLDLLAQYLCNLVCLDIRHPWLLFRFQLLAQPDQLLAHRTIVDG